MITKVIRSIKKYKKFLITSHLNPEPDALGSELSLAMLLISMNKEVVVCNSDPVTFDYNFLPHVNMVKSPKYIKSYKYDAAISVDCSELSRLGVMSKIIPKDKLIFNIDHHIRNSRFAKINWIDTKASSCSELIYRLYKRVNKPIDKDIALLLYSAIVSDTGSFKYPNTTSFSHKVAADLLDWDLPVNKIFQNIYGNISYPDSRKIILALQTMQTHANGRIVYFVLEKNSSKLSRNSQDLSDYILDFARAIKDVEMVILFKPVSSNEVRISLRSKGSVDVCKFATMFAGGGHRTASGCTVRKSLQLTKGLILKKAKKFIKE